MKLRNKKTGEIRDFIINKDKIQTASAIDCWEYSSIAELNKEWEDYAEPEGWWFIGRDYEPHATNSTLRNLEADREIGNYFGTKEEAEKAVEKLKAWQRLKDKGFKFIGVRTIGKVIDFVIPRKYCGVSSDSFDEETLEFYHDLDLLFGGKNETI